MNEPALSHWSNRAWRGVSLLMAIAMTLAPLGALWVDMYAMAGAFVLSAVLFWWNHVGVVRATRILDRRYSRSVARLQGRAADPGSPQRSRRAQWEE